EGTFRLSVSGGAGEIFLGSGIQSQDLFMVKGEVTAGLSLYPYGTPFLRAALRGLKYDHGVGFSGWGRDEELGLGYEIKVWRLIVGGEAYLWARPALASLPQWKVVV